MCVQVVNMNLKMISLVFGVLPLLLASTFGSCFQNSCYSYQEVQNSQITDWNYTLYHILKDIIEQIEPFKNIQLLFEKFKEKFNNFHEESSNVEPYEGYTIFGPEYSRYTYLLDMDKKIVHTWTSNYIQGFGGYLLENGEMLRLDLPFDNAVFVSGGVAGRVEKFDEESNLLWEFGGYIPVHPS